MRLIGEKVSTYIYFGISHYFITLNFSLTLPQYDFFFIFILHGYVQDCGLSATSSLFSTVLCTAQNQMAPKLQLNNESVKMGKKFFRLLPTWLIIDNLLDLPITIVYKSAGSVTSQNFVSSREEAANFVRKALRRKVMVSSTRQAVSGFLAAGGATAARYVARKMSKAWKSRTS